MYGWIQKRNTILIRYCTVRRSILIFVYENFWSLKRDAAEDFRRFATYTRAQSASIGKRFQMHTAFHGQWNNENSTS